MHTNSLCAGTGHDLCILLHAGSPVYVAPEVLQKKYGQKADVWSAGMVAYLLLCARLPWKGDQSITTSDLYVSMGDGKTFNRKVLLMHIQRMSHVFRRPRSALFTSLSQLTCTSSLSDHWCISMSRSRLEVAGCTQQSAQTRVTESSGSFDHTMQGLANFRICELLSQRCAFCLQFQVKHCTTLSVGTMEQSMRSLQLQRPCVMRT